jgi:hypothetical protein
VEPVVRACFEGLAAVGAGDRRSGEFFGAAFGRVSLDVEEPLPSS